MSNVDDHEIPAEECANGGTPVRAGNAGRDIGFWAFVNSFPLERRLDPEGAYLLWVERGFAENPLAAELLFLQVQERIAPDTEWVRRLGAITPAAYLRDRVWGWL